MCLILVLGVILMFFKIYSLIWVLIRVGDIMIFMLLFKFELFDYGMF